MPSALTIQARRGTLANEAARTVGASPHAIRITRRSGVFNHDQAYFWTEEWQAGEQEADEDLREGRYIDFDDPAELLDFLRNL